MYPLSMACGIWLPIAAALAAANAPESTSTVVLGPWTGVGARLHPDNPRPIGYFGTDLGITYEHGGALHVLFGDTWATESSPIDSASGSDLDDAFGTIDLEKWPDPALIRPGHLPAVRLAQLAGSNEVRAIDPGFPLGVGRTPMAAFSSGRREFAIFYTGLPKACRTRDDCGGGLVCDTMLGASGDISDERARTVPCVAAQVGCSALPPLVDDGVRSERGLCTRTDTASDDAHSRLAATAERVLIGVRDEADPARYRIIGDWTTARFRNVTANVAPHQAPACGDDESRPAPAERRILLWGRPGFFGIGALSRSLDLYFAYVDLPNVPGDLPWRVRYFAGVDDDGCPLYSGSESDAVALDLDGSRAGVQTTEPHDIVNQMSVAWVPAMKKWLMVYGGGMSTLPRAGFSRCGLVEVLTGPQCRWVDAGNGAVRMRTADRPWGPWSPPVDVLVPGDPRAATPDGQYAEGGMLRHPACRGDDCAPHAGAPIYEDEEYGFFYGANLIEPWVRSTGSTVDLYWNASTWDPYRVVLLRTRVRF